MEIPNSTLASRHQAIQQARDILLKKPVYLDTETTGLEKNDEIIEISIIDDDGKTIFEQLFRPTQPISNEARQVHKITDDQVKNKPTWAAYWNIVRGHLFNRLIGAYNVDFDLRMIQQTNSRYGIRRETFNTFDVMKIFAMYRGMWDPQRRSYRYFKLEEAAQYCNLPTPSLHRSSDDALLTCNLLHFIAKTDL